MILRYALYERKPPQGYQWTWRAGDLNDSLLDDFVYRISIPNNASQISPDELRGGIIKFSQTNGPRVDVHLVFYRFYDGGSDEGRSRVTILAAWAEPDQIPAYSTEKGLLKIFCNQMFEHISKNARTIGIEPPYRLIVKENLAETNADPSAALAEFLGGLNEEDFDYSFKIENGLQTIEKTESETFRFKQAKKKILLAENSEEVGQKTKIAKMLVDISANDNCTISNNEITRAKQIIRRPFFKRPLIVTGAVLVGFCAWIVLSLDQLKLVDVAHPPPKIDLKSTENFQFATPAKKSNSKKIKGKPEDDQSRQKDNSFPTKVKDTTENRDLKGASETLDEDLNHERAGNVNFDKDVTVSGMGQNSDPFQLVGSQWPFGVALIGILIIFIIWLAIITKDFFLPAEKAVLNRLKKLSLKSQMKILKELDSIVNGGG